MYKFETSDGAESVIDTKDILKLKIVNEDTEVTLKSGTEILITGMWGFYSDSMGVVHMIRTEPSYFEEDKKLSRKLFLNGLFSSHCKRCKYTNNLRTTKPCSGCIYDK